MAKESSTVLAVWIRKKDIKVAMLDEVFVPYIPMQIGKLWGLWQG